MPTSNDSNIDPSAQFDRLLFGPVRALAGLSLVYSELLLQSQVDAARACSEISIRHLRGALEIRSRDDLRAFLDGHVDLANSVRAQAVDEAENLQRLHELYAEQLRKLTDVSVTQWRQAIERVA
ncbi:GAF domain-containing protein [Natronocella acetinitrilica]|uniref:GAF domain-containing protein n=1 Tax=Natronocella acetinitrilica TaxID=414046 RepID=A0AAE3G2W8_9GAMM|nr:hypothetical protein [Natronocella acetinitrilica]MCP1674649.1 GAF domain-containing protein [Natronocella acetinitrilica]